MDALDERQVVDIIPPRPELLASMVGHWDMMVSIERIWFETEETKDADKNGPKGIVGAIGISLIVGWAYILGIPFAVTDIPHLLSKNNGEGGYAIAQIFYDAFNNRFGSGVGGIGCLGIIAVAIFFCGMSSLTSNSRMAYAFSRDGATPFSPFCRKVNEQEVPINTVGMSAVIAFCMALTSLGSLVAFQAMTSIATIGLYIAYALPSLIRVTLARKSSLQDRSTWDGSFCIMMDILLLHLVVLVAEMKYNILAPKL